jgi:shikimate kinase
LEGPVAIVGYMGSGKTTVGRLLARRLGWEFVDLDRRISERAGLTIPEIFAEHGEGRFRDLEHLALREALGGEPERGVACGGGAVLRPENRRALEGARTIFLEEDPRILYARTRGAGRPLRGASREGFEGRYRERLPLYHEVADLEIPVGGRSVGEVVEEVARWLDA